MATLKKDSPDHKYSVELGKTLQTLREMKDYTILEVACRLGIDRLTYRTYEFGQNKIPLITVIKLLSLYNITFEELTKDIKIEEI